MRLEVTTATTQPTLYVIATRFESSRPVLETAIPLARGSGAQLVLLVPQIVPYPIPLDRPVDSTVFLERRYRALMEEAGGEGDVTACLCRRPVDVMTRLLPPGATVVLGGDAGHWLPSRHERLEHQLHRLGYHVVYVPVAGPGTPAY